MSKDSSPGLWDSSASGHLDCGEDYDACAVRELREELADCGYSVRTAEWSEAEHIDRYFELIASIRAGRSATPHRPAARRTSVAAR